MGGKPAAPSMGGNAGGAPPGCSDGIPGGEDTSPKGGRATGGPPIFGTSPKGGAAPKSGTLSRPGGAPNGLSPPASCAPPDFFVYPFDLVIFFSLSNMLLIMGQQLWIKYAMYNICTYNHDCINNCLLGSTISSRKSFCRIICNSQIHNDYILNDVDTGGDADATGN